MIRTFIAIEIPAPIKDELLQEYYSLKDLVHGACGHKGVKWVDPTNWHITIKFLGEIQEALLSSCQEILSGCCISHGSVKIRFKNIGCFPSPNRPRVIWAGVEEKNGGLSSINACLESSFERLGVKRTEQPFHAHLTFCRIKSPSPRHGPLMLDLMKRQFSTAWFEPQGISLYKSTLTPRGPIYSLIFKAPLTDR